MKSHIASLLSCGSLLILCLGLTSSVDAQGIANKVEEMHESFRPLNKDVSKAKRLKVSNISLAHFNETAEQLGLWVTPDDPSCPKGKYRCCWLRKGCTNSNASDECVVHGYNDRYVCCPDGGNCRSGSGQKCSWDRGRREYRCYPKCANICPSGGYCKVGQNCCNKVCIPGCRSCCNSGGYCGYGKKCCRGWFGKAKCCTVGGFQCLGRRNSATGCTTYGYGP